jgi:hypothetical protein
MPVVNQRAESPIHKYGVGFQPFAFFAFPFSGALRQAGMARAFGAAMSLNVAI